MNEVEAVHVIQQDGDVRPVGQNGTDGLRDVGRGQAAGRHLIEQRLEQMMICAVHQRDAGIGHLKLFAERQAAEARTQNNDMNWPVLCHGNSSVRKISPKPD